MTEEISQPVQDPLFDMLEMYREQVRARPWHGIALGEPTMEFHTPEELDAGMQRWIDENGEFGCIPRSHMWHRESPDVLRDGPMVTAFGHELVMYSAHPDEESMLWQAICPGCRWHHVGRSENDPVEAWHDHAMPGWRELPLVPAEVDKANRGAWLKEAYPAGWQADGAPILTRRSERGRRHVPRYSPLGGYDMAAEEIDRR